ncbi:acyltransferase [Clostridium culturomicium]|uniref:acyltransferase n=1 Tax=Clostridium culturomicium TaxID=1499683 RepID=UPI00059122E6|nr:acyltransferase [Clostridium culturomicium]
MNSFYNEQELKDIGFKSIGENVLISRKTSIYGAENIALGSHVRIDDFCILSGKIEVGSFVHISAYSVLYGGDKGIVMEDFSGISSRTTIYAISDDFTGEAMTNPMVYDECRKVYSEEVRLGKYVQIGASSVILPGVDIGEGAAIGACSLVTEKCEPWTISVGTPAKVIKKRKKNILELEEKYYKK